MAVRDAVQDAQRDSLRDLLELLDDGIVAVRTSLEVEYANAAARRLFGETPLVVDGTLPDPWPEVSLHDLVAAALGAPERPLEAKLEAAGRTYVVRCGLGGDRRAALLVFRDVTEVERRERAERDFVTNAAHQLRSPVAAISGVIEVLQGGAKELREERDRFLGHLERDCARLVRATSALLTLARAQSGREAPRREIVELCPLLEGVVAELRPRAGVTVTIECPADLVLVADPGLVREAVANVAVNAARHTKHGRIRVRAQENNGTVIVEVSDTGPGMSAEVQARATERFYRSAQDDPDGFGLGLAIAAQALEATGGSLELDSGPGRGTVVRMTFRAGRLVSA